MEDSVEPSTTTLQGNRNPGQRLAALDGLRGMAALAVVVRHTFGAIAMPLDVRHAFVEGPLGVLTNAMGAVHVFFVLSGFVLAASLGRGRGLSGVIQFYVKRVFRIYPPYVAALLAAWAASFVYAIVPLPLGVTEHVAILAHVHLDLPRLLASLSFPGIAYQQLPVGWTLRIEMLFSLFLPAMFLVARRLHWTVLMGISMLGLWLPDQYRDFWYALAFSAGIAIFLDAGSLAASVHWCSWPVTALGVVASLCLLDAPFLVGWTTIRAGILIGGFDRPSVVLITIGAAGMILAALHVQWFSSALASRPCVWLGKISYSLYLLHMTALIACTFVYAPSATWLAGVILVALVVGVSCALAAVSYQWIERPFIHAGNALCVWLSSRMGTTAVPSRDI